MRVRSRCDVPSEPTSISGMSALHGLAGQGWVTDIPRMNPVQWRGMPSTFRAVPAANVDRRSRDGQEFRRTLVISFPSIMRVLKENVKMKGRARPLIKACAAVGLLRLGIGALCQVVYVRL